jgi:Rieske Fe-S protein
MNEPEADRRRFLRVLAGCFGAGVGSGGGGKVTAGKVADLGSNALEAVSGAGVAIGRDAGGLYAVSLICTHQGCDMSFRGSVDKSGIFCDCHGASFDRYGAVTGGPANGPLEHYAVSVDAQGQITIDLDTVVADDKRVAV